MHLKKSHVEIMNLYRKDIFLSRTIREVSFLLKKDYPNTYNSVMELYKNKIIKIKKVGKSSVCELNLNFQGVSLLSFLDEQEALSKKIPNIANLLFIPSPNPFNFFNGPIADMHNGLCMFSNTAFMGYYDNCLVFLLV